MTKLTGPEMLLKNLLGIDPKEMQQTVTSMIVMVREIHGFMAEIRGRLEVIERNERLERLEKFLPILEEVFAGRIGGTSNDSGAVLDVFNTIDFETAKAALEANATAAKETEIPVVPAQSSELKAGEGLASA